MTIRRGAGIGAALMLITAVLLGLVAPASAQGVEAVRIVGTDVSGFPTVRLSVALSGEAAESPPEDIEVTENGEPVEAELEGTSDQVIDVVLVMDVSGSMAGEPINQARAAALQFVDQLPDTARVAVVTFGNSAELVSGFTDDRGATQGDINGLDDGGETALYDGVVLATEQLAGSDADRTAMVVLSDGGDTVSDATLEAATGALEGVETSFYAVALQSGETDEAALAALAEAAGGQVVAATDPDALSAAYVDVGEAIANQYEVVFESTTDQPTAVWEVAVAGESDSINLALPDRPAGAPTTTEVAGPQAAPERITTTVEAKAIQKDWVLWIGAGLVGIALAVTAWAVWPTGPRRRRRSLRSDRIVEETGTGERIVESVREGVTRVTTRAIERTESSGTIDDALDRAGLVMRAGEFVALVLGVVVAASLVLFLLLGPVGLALGVFVPILGAPTFLRFLGSRRNRKFADQLSDTLTLMAGSLRSGFGIGQTIDAVAQEMDAPIGAEFQRALLEVRLGRELDDALDGVARRMDSEDFQWVVDAIRINREVGGNLAEILDQVAETIRARNRLQRQVAALTAEGRMSGIVLAALPPGLTLILYASNPDYLKPMFEETAGWLMLGGAVFLLVIGGLWLKKLVDVEKL